MWLTLIVSGALHGLVLLPVVLSIAGGPGLPQQEADEAWMSHAIRDDDDYPYVPCRSFRILFDIRVSRPFLADDNSVASD
jgi:Niemann-Pick C1 protein